MSKSKILQMEKANILFFCIFPCIATYAQDTTKHQRSLTVKFPISSLFGDIFAQSMGVGIGIEKMTKTNFSVSQEIGYIFHVNHSSILAEKNDHIYGLKTTSEIRRYFNQKEIPASGFFANLELKNIFTHSVTEVWTSQNIKETQKTERYRGALTSNLGVLFYWDKHKQSRITMELLAGGGVGYAKSCNHESNYNSTHKFYPCANLDIKIGYVFH